MKCYIDTNKRKEFRQKGTEGDPPKELRELLYYMENTTEENAINDSLKRIHQMVILVKH